jgi:hypothetical protein
MIATIIILVLGSLADVLTTRYMLKRGATEMNPLVKASTPKKTVDKLVLLKAVAIVGCLGIMPWCGYIPALCVGIGSWAAAGWNGWQMYRWRKSSKKTA